MMGILPETSRLRTSVSLVIILLIGICFLGFTYWTQLNHSQSYQRKIAFLERTISKMSKAEDEADGREADFQKELRKHKQGLQHMNAMAHQEIMRLKYQCTQDQDRFTQTIEEKDAVIKEKEDLMSNMKQAYLKMQQDMEVFQKNQSQLLEKFTLQSEKMEMLVRLKDRCYSQMNSISKSISVPSLPSDVAAAGRSSKTQDKGSREEQPEGKRDAVNIKADPPTTVPAKPPTPPSAVRIPIPLLKILEQFKGQFTDNGSKEHRSGVKAEVNVTSPPAAKPSASPSLSKALIQRLIQRANKLNNLSREWGSKEHQSGVKAEVNVTSPPAAKPSASPSLSKALIQRLIQRANKLNNLSRVWVKGRDTNSETPKNITSPATVVNGDDHPAVLKPNDKEEKKKKQETMDEEVNEAVERKQPTQPLNDEPDVLKPNDKEMKTEQEPMDEEVNEVVERKQPTQPLNDVPDVLKPNDIEKKKEQEPMDEEVNKAVEEVEIDQPPADEPDIVKSNEKLEAKKEEELKDRKSEAVVKEKQPAQPLEDELDLLQPNMKEEAKNEEEPF